MRIAGFIWDDADDESGNVAHIARHGVSPEEVEEALINNPLVLRGTDGRYLAYGKSAEGRLLFVVFVRRGRGLIRPLTARAMTDRETRLYRRRRGE